MKNLQFLKIFKEISRLFQKLFKISSNFWQNLGNNLENLEMCICGSGAESPDASEFIEIWVEKSMKTCYFSIVLIEILPFFPIF